MIRQFAGPKYTGSGTVSQTSWESLLEHLTLTGFIQLRKGEYINAIEADDRGLKIVYGQITDLLNK